MYVVDMHFICVSSIQTRNLLFNLAICMHIVGIICSYLFVFLFLCSLVNTRFMVLSLHFPLLDDDPRTARQDPLSPLALGSTYGSATGAILQEAGPNVAQTLSVEVVGQLAPNSPYFN